MQQRPRKEFFFATPAEVRDVLIEKLGSLLEFSEVGESMEYHQSRRYWPDRLEDSTIAAMAKYRT